MSQTFDITEYINEQIENELETKLNAIKDELTQYYKIKYENFEKKILNNLNEKKNKLNLKNEKNDELIEDVQKQ